MDSPFAFEKVAAGRSIIGRKEQIERMKSILTESEKGVSIYDTPRSGKEVVVQEVLSHITSSKKRTIICEMNLFNIRSWKEFFNLMKIKMEGCFEEASKGALLPFKVDMSELPAKKIADIPQKLAQDTGTLVIIYIKDFHAISSFEDSDTMTAECLDKIWAKHTDVRYILTGSSVGRMKDIFEKRKLFYSSTIHVDLPRIDKILVCNFIVNSFLNIGRVIENEEALLIYQITGGNMWYVKQVCSFCCALPAGYINHSVVSQALEALFSTHSVRFQQIVNDLTFNQLNLLRAINDGVTKFSSAEILDKYKLNSSANVFRIKEALEKKDVITFDQSDVPYLLDPLFEYWLKHYYFI